MVEHPPGQPADDLEPRAVDVVQGELVDVEAGDEFRRVGRTGADDGDLHPFTPVSVTPSTKAFWAARKSRITGAMNRIVAIIVRFHCTWYVVRKCESPIESVQ